MGEPQTEPSDQLNEGKVLKLLSMPAIQVQVMSEKEKNDSKTKEWSVVPVLTEKSDPIVESHHH